MSEERSRERRDEQSSNQTNQDQGVGDGRQESGGPAGQGQPGEEYGVYGRGASEGGRYADAGDSVKGMAPQGTTGASQGAGSGQHPSPQRNPAQQEIARKQGQENVEEHARPQKQAVEEEQGSTLHAVGARPREGQNTSPSEADGESWRAPRHSTWKQNSGAETTFGGKHEADSR